MKIFLAVFLLLTSACVSNSHTDRPNGTESGKIPTPKPASATYFCNSPNYQGQECPVQPLGSLKESVAARNGQIYTRWHSDCGCHNGIPSGNGWAVWCISSFNCASDNKQNFLGQVSAKIDNGKYVGPVKINSYLGQYSGSITPTGDYYRGILFSKSGEKFIGELNPDGTYKTGTLYSNGKIYISSNFQSNKPSGVVAIGDELGNYQLYDCRSATSGCIISQQGNDEGIKILLAMIKEVTSSVISEKFEQMAIRLVPLMAKFKFALGLVAGYAIGEAIDIGMEWVLSIERRSY